MKGQSTAEIVRGYIATHENLIMSDLQKTIVGQAVKCRLSGFVLELVDMFSNRAAYADLTLEARILRCLERELQIMSISRFERMYRASLLPYKIPLSAFQPMPERGLTSELLLTLIRGEYLERMGPNGCRNIVFSGNPGVGKTTMATATALEAIRKGFSAIFFRMNEFVTMLDVKSDTDFLKFKDKLANIRVLVLDDFGHEVLSDRVIVRLNEIATARYGSGSTIFTTHLKKGAENTIGNPSLVLSTLINKLFRPADMFITITGPSWRGTPGELNPLGYGLGADATPTGASGGIGGGITAGAGAAADGTSSVEGTGIGAVAAGTGAVAGAGNATDTGSATGAATLTALGVGTAAAALAPAPVATAAPAPTLVQTSGTATGGAI